ncbi:MAG: hypothetical protein AAGN82_17785, partial [Myxococcota bacterium]
MTHALALGESVHDELVHLEVRRVQPRARGQPLGDVDGVDEVGRGHGPRHRKFGGALGPDGSWGDFVGDVSAVMVVAVCGEPMRAATWEDSDR